MRNLFSVPEQGGSDSKGETFEALLTGPDGLLVERIVSHGHTTPEGSWYDQDRDEWVLVLEGTAALTFEDGTEIRLKKGEHAFLPRRHRHKVTYTSAPCIWLAVHGRLDPLFYEQERAGSM